MLICCNEDLGHASVGERPTDKLENCDKRDSLV